MPCANCKTARAGCSGRKVLTKMGVPSRAGSRNSLAFIVAHGTRTSGRGVVQFVARVSVKLRESNLVKLGQREFDVLIVGGGINGAVSAAALSSQGAKVALIDRDDFAGFTSQESSNLVWGGIKYLESFEFLLVRKLCLSRNRLLQA